MNKENKRSWRGVNIPMLVIVKNIEKITKPGKTTNLY